jgi:hypothetical protein
MAGRFEDLRDLLNVEGRSFCGDCRIAFYGRYDPNNPALMELLANKASRKKQRTFVNLFSDEQQELFREAMAYSEQVRRQSRANLRRFAKELNPCGHKLGRSGVRGAYQLDHIIPVLVCWQYGVSDANASAVGNLQVIPWFVNLSRGGGPSARTLRAVRCCNAIYGINMHEKTSTPHPKFLDFARSWWDNCDQIVSAFDYGVRTYFSVAITFSRSNISGKA